MQTSACSRRGFFRAGAGLAATAVAASVARSEEARLPSPPGPVPRPIVAVVRIRNGDLARGVEEAVDLLGGMAEVTRGRNRILLKPNLVVNESRCTTKPAVVGELARLMKAAGKEVSIGEASVIGATRCVDVLGPYQDSFFQSLGYTAMARAAGVPLVNLHLGPFVTVPVPDGLFWEELVLPRPVVDADLVCSVAMMKTHIYATVTLTLKNAIGLYPGAIYGSYRWWVHDNAYLRRSPGVAYEILDMVRAARFGLSVIDASMAMEGNGPTDGTLVPMNLILAGTEPLATDLVGAAIMGIPAGEVPTFEWAHRLGMKPTSLEDIELRGVALEDVRRRFVRAALQHPGNGGDNAPVPAPFPRIEPAGPGRMAVTWAERAPCPVLRFNDAGKARVEWTDAPTLRRSVLERSSTLQPRSWERIEPATPGRHEFDVSGGARSYFRLRQP